MTPITFAMGKCEKKDLTTNFLYTMYHFINLYSTFCPTVNVVFSSIGTGDQIYMSENRLLKSDTTMLLSKTAEVLQFSLHFSLW